MGAGTFATVIPVQHRLVQADPEAAAVSLSWYSTAMYVGIAVEPLWPGLHWTSRAIRVPLIGTIAALSALVVFLAGYRRRATRDPEPAP